MPKPIVESHASALFASSIEFIQNGTVRLDVPDRLLSLEAREDWLNGRAAELILSNWGPVGKAGRMGYPFFESAISLGDTVEIKVDGGRLVKGFVRAVEGFYEQGTQPRLGVTIASELERLESKERSRIFEEMTIGEMVELVCHAYGFSVDTSGAGLSLEAAAQEGETDFDFLAELLEESDLYWFFDDSDQLKVRKRHISPPSSLSLNPNGKLKRYEARADLQGMASHLEAKQVNERTGEVESAVVDLSSGAIADLGAGSGPAAAESVFGECFRNWNGGRLGASGLVEGTATAFRQLARQFLIGNGESVFNLSMRVGSRVTFTGLGEVFDGVAFVSAVRHRFDREDGWRTLFSCEHAQFGASMPGKKRKSKTKAKKKTASPRMSAKEKRTIATPKPRIGKLTAAKPAVTRKRRKTVSR